MTPGSAEHWLKHAQSDLRAGVLLKSDAAVMREQVCFHFQQAAEKALKGVLVKRGVDFPRAHDLAQLIALLIANRTAVPKTVRRAERLTPYAVQTRYPADLPEIPDDELETAETIAVSVVTWAVSRITPKRKPRAATKPTKLRKA